TAQNTKKPQVLRELFEILGNDPFVIAECLARPTLAERFANGDPVATASNAFGAAHPAGMPPQKPLLAGWLAKAETQVPMKVAAIETRSLPSSLPAAHRGFTFYLADPSARLDSIAKAVQVNRPYHLP